jgi:hypothetical protein
MLGSASNSEKLKDFGQKGNITNVQPLVLQGGLGKVLDYKLGSTALVLLFYKEVGYLKHAHLRTPNIMYLIQNNICEKLQ